MASLKHVRQWNSLKGLVLIIPLLVLSVLSPTESSAQAPQVQCAIPKIRAISGDCNDYHVLDFQALGTVQNLQAELLGFDSHGNLLTTIPNVQNGDIAQLNGRLNPTGGPGTWQKNKWHLFAPLPVLHVTGMDPGTGHKLEAFCSNVPYLNMMTPKGTVVTAGESEAVHVFTTLPLVSLANLEIMVDGTDMVPLLKKMLAPATLSSCTPATPCTVNGITLGNGDMIDIANLVVDVAPTYATFASNTISFDLMALSCGGHKVEFEGHRATGAPPRGASGHCYVDNLVDSGDASVFSIQITKPTEGEAGLSYPVEVTGEACSGLPIAGIDINGHAVNLTTEVTTCSPLPPPGTYKICFDAHLAETDLAGDVQGTVTTLGTFDPGSNRVLARATDARGNRTFDSVLFATGPTLNPGVPLALQSLLQPQASAALHQQLIQQLGPIVQSLPETVNVDNAFLVGMKKEAVQKIFDELCKSAAQTFKTKGEPALKSVALPSFVVDPGPCSCNVTAHPYVQSATVELGTESCTLDFQQDVINVTMKLPDVSMDVEAHDHCGSCGVSKTEIDVTLTFKLKDWQVKFAITEQQLMPTTVTKPPPLTVAGSIVDNHLSGGINTPCFIGTVCEFFIDVLTFGIAAFLFEPSFDINLADVDFQQAIDGKTDPPELNKMKVNKEQIAVANIPQNVEGNITKVQDIQITTEGILAALQGTFQVLAVDPSIPATPGTHLRNPITPTLAEAILAGAKDVFIGLNDDTINMLFAGMTMGGALKASCVTGNPPVTVASLLPNCDTLVDPTSPPNQAVTDVLRGVCHALKGDVCESLTGPTATDAAIIQGTCHGFNGDNCATIAVSSIVGDVIAEYAACGIAGLANMNIHGTDKILFCTKEDIPPSVLLKGTTPPNTVNSSLRLNDLSVALVLDRGGDFVPPVPNDLNIGSFPACFAEGASKVGDCQIYGLCLDVNINFDMNFVDDPSFCPAGTNLAKPGFKFKFVDVQFNTARPPGVVCGGSQPTIPKDRNMVDAASTNQTVTVALGDNAEFFAPPICMDGLLGFGGLLKAGNTPLFDCTNPELFTMTKGGTPAGFADYLALTCNITKIP